MKKRVGVYTLLIGSSLVWGENLIKNGSFEELDIIKKRRLYTIAHLKDWDSNSAMRLWPNRKFGKATDGEYKLALDTNKGAVDFISQKVETQKNALYQICLDARGRHNRSSNLKVLVDDKELLNIHPSRSSWHNYCATFVGTGTAQTITLSELENESNGKGPIIDNVVLEKIKDLVENENNTTEPAEDNNTLAEDENLIKNGSFENFEPQVVRRLYTIGTLENWVDKNGNPAVMRLWPPYKFGETPDGKYKLALDTRKRGFDAISQTIVTQSDKIYKLCIDGRGRKNRSSYFSVLIDGERL
ncbi:MAG: DUF642 domain-containing protein, partial [Epsilonproteobacteria bacterium]|nr:DUF642 domain-containing protein [Campylobacterota bacterium]